MAKKIYSSGNYTYVENDGSLQFLVAKKEAQFTFNGDVDLLLFNKRTLASTILEGNATLDENDIVLTRLQLITFLEDNTSNTGNNGGSSGNALIPEDQRVNTYADLPSASSNDGKYYIVDQATGTRILGTRKEAGIYKSVSSSWDYRGADVPYYLLDDQFTIKDSTDNTKQLGFEVSNISTSTRRTVIWQDKDGTVAYLEDVIPEAPTDGAIYMRDGSASSWIKKLGVIYSFDIASKGSQQNANNGVFRGRLKLLRQGSYNTFDTVFEQISLGTTQFYTLRAGLYDANTGNLLTQGSTVLNNTNQTSQSFTLNTEINIKTPTWVYLVAGVNDNSGGGTLYIVRESASALNQAEVSFQFNQNTGALPSTLPSVTAQNNAYYQVYYGL